MEFVVSLETLQGGGGLRPPLAVNRTGVIAALLERQLDLLVASPGWGPLAVTVADTAGSGSFSFGCALWRGSGETSREPGCRQGSRESKKGGPSHVKLQSIRPDGAGLVTPDMRPRLSWVEPLATNKEGPVRPRRASTCSILPSLVRIRVREAPSSLKK